MKAVVFHGAENLAVENVPEPKAKPGDLVIKPYHAMICKTDVLNLEKWPPQWSASNQNKGRWPSILTEGIIPGHEAGGEVVEVTKGAGNFKVGDRITIDAFYHCGECPECRNSLWGRCRVYAHKHKWPDVTFPTALGINAADPSDFGNGFMAEYVAAPAYMCYKCPETISDLATVGAQLGGPTLTSVRTSGMQLGDNVVQIGGTSHGGYRMQLVRIAGADHIVYVEPNAARRKWAAEHKLADTIIDPDADDPVERVKELFPAGADVVFPSNEITGSWRMASEMLRQQGTMVPIDSDPRLGQVYLDGFEGGKITGTGIRINGHWPPFGCAEFVKGEKDRNDCQIFVDLMAQRRVDGASPVTYVVSLQDGAEKIKEAYRRAWTTEVMTAVRIWGK